MRLLLVAATAAEVAPLLTALGPASEGSSARNYGSHEIEVLVTGVGMVATATSVATALATAPYDAALNLGVCGSFDRTRPLGAVVHVTIDSFPELGVEDGERFVPATAAGLVEPNETPMTDGRCVNRTLPAWPTVQALPTVTGVTVNTVHGTQASIAALCERIQADVESMEGAAFLYTCLLRHIPCAQVRAVSNYVERRDRAAWRLDDAIEALNATGLRILEDL
jgi:futalosine hydrolase